jgi:hypothetical protein
MSAISGPRLSCTIWISDVPAEPVLGRLNIPAEAFLGRLNVLSEAFLSGPEILLRRSNRRCQPAAQLDQNAVVFIERFDGRIDACQYLPVEFHLLPDVPVQHASHQPLPGLDHGVAEPAAARVHCADRGHFAERRIARVHQPHEVGHGDALRALPAHSLADLPQNGDQLSAFHVSCSRLR